MNIVRTIQNFIFGVPPLALITSAQSEIVAAREEADYRIDLATIDIEIAVDAELDSIRQTVAAAFSRIRPLLATGAVDTNGAKALTSAQAQIEKVLATLDAAI